MLLVPLWWSRLVPAPVLRQGVRAAVHRGGTTVVCTSNYKGAEVEWDVAIGDKSAWSDNVVTFTANPRKGIIAKEGVQRIIFGNGGDSVDHIRRDDIPEAVAVPLGPTK